MPVAFLIARQRSGTGALVSILHSHPQISSLGEVFHDQYDENTKRHAYFKFLKGLLQKDPELTLPHRAEERFDAYIEHLERQHPEKIILIDAKYRSLGHFNGVWHSASETPRMLWYIKQRHMPVLHLNRKNFLATWVSGRLAEANKVWHTGNKDRINVDKIWIDPDLTLHYLQQTARETRIISESFQNYDRIAFLEYSQLLTPENTVRPKAEAKIIETLGLKSPIETATPLIKQAPQSVRESIKNLSEIENLLKNGPFEWMIAPGA